MKRSKLYRARAGLFDRQTYYELEKAVELLKQMPPLKFEDRRPGLRLGGNPRQADQIVRGAMVCPRHSKEQKVVVIAAACRTAKLPSKQVARGRPRRFARAGWSWASRFALLGRKRCPWACADAANPKPT